MKMSEKRFIRDIQGNILDTKKDKWFEEDWKGKSLDYDDDLIVFLNEQECTISALREENEKLSEKNRRLIYHMNKEPKR